MKEKSPHGSWPREVLRKLANILLSDAQRKGIKSALRSVARAPARILGVSSLIEAQQQEIERLKGRVISGETRLRLALHGLPDPTGTRDDLLSETVMWGSSGHPNWNPAWAEVPLIGALQSLRGKGLVLNAFPAVQEHLTKRLTELSLQFFSSYGISALTAHVGQSFACVFSLGGFSHFSPLEQREFVRVGMGLLSPGGRLAILVMNPELDSVRSDSFWRDPKNLRLFSLSALQAEISAQGGEAEILREGEWILVAAKRRSEKTGS